MEVDPKLTPYEINVPEEKIAQKGPSFPKVLQEMGKMLLQQANQLYANVAYLTKGIVKGESGLQRTLHKASFFSKMLEIKLMGTPSESVSLLKTEMDRTRRELKDVVKESKSLRRNGKIPDTDRQEHLEKKLNGLLERVEKACQIPLPEQQLSPKKIKETLENTVKGILKDVTNRYNSIASSSTEAPSTVKRKSSVKRREIGQQIAQLKLAGKESTARRKTAEAESASSTTIEELQVKQKEAKVVQQIALPALAKKQSVVKPRERLFSDKMNLFSEKVTSPIQWKLFDSQCDTQLAELDTKINQLYPKTLLNRMDKIITQVETLRNQANPEAEGFEATLYARLDEALQGLMQIRQTFVELPGFVDISDFNSILKADILEDGDLIELTLEPESESEMMRKITPSKVIQGSTLGDFVKELLPTEENEQREAIETQEKFHQLSSEKKRIEERKDRAYVAHLGVETIDEYTSNETAEELRRNFRESILPPRKEIT